VSTKGLRVQVGADKFGWVHFTELQDDYCLNVYQLKGQLESWLGGYRPCVVLREEPLQLSFRESLFELGMPRHMAELAPWKDREQNGDLRTRLALFGVAGLKVGMLFMGYIKSCSEKGCFITLAEGVDIRVPLAELSDEPVKNPAAEFYPGMLALGRLTREKMDPSNPIDKRMEGSMRASIIQHGYCVNDSTLKPGLVVAGRVWGHTRNSAIISIEGCNERGVLCPG
jgi:hypothetical protein